MASLARLSFDAAESTRGLAEDPLVLVALYDVPLLWAAAFDEEELEVDPPASGEIVKVTGLGFDEITASEHFVFASTVALVRARLQTIADHVAASPDPWTRAALGSCEEIARVLADIDEGAHVCLDANRVAIVAAPGVIREALRVRARDFHRLRASWSDARARDIVCSLRPDVFRGALSHDASRARRVTDAASDRLAFFTLAFGTAEGTLSGPLRAWLEAAPPGPALRPLGEEARLLAEMLVEHGLAAFPPGGRADALRYLGLAARLRTPAALREILELLYTQGLIDPGAVPSGTYGPEEGRARPLDAPVFDEVTLAAIVQMLDAG